MLLEAMKHVWLRQSSYSLVILFPQTICFAMHMSQWHNPKSSYTLYYVDMSLVHIYLNPNYSPIPL